MSIEAKNRKIRVLFVCVHNSARSQMAEAFLNHLGGGLFEAESAGLEPAEINPLVIEVTKEIGIDISTNRADSVFYFLSRAGFTDMWLPCVTRRAPNGARFLQAMQPMSTGHLRTRQALPAAMKKGWGK